MATQHHAPGERPRGGGAPAGPVLDRTALRRTPLGYARRRRGPGRPSPPHAPPPSPSPSADTPQPGVRRALLAVTSESG